ncbi:LemA family protein [Wohlfahrtiimonas larvae]|uniref:LemA family protein n=1 Tax=Wohlfahrtiimonas larvae TaxID=1157986 RepID=A0ABP9MBX5_9GAMM|nr:LemA family protein [Wohlfahrtiimonas larvae]
MTGLIILASIIGLSAIGSTIVLLVQCYNRLMKARVAVDQQFANIDIFLKQRADEIPELVKILKAENYHDLKKINELTKIYEHYQNSQEMKTKLLTSEEIHQELYVVLATMPSSAFTSLKKRLIEIETQLAQRREMFNDSVATFNALILRIPYIILAAMLKIEACQYLEIGKLEKSYHGVDL